METTHKPLSVFLVDDDKMYLLSLQHKLIKQFKSINFFTFASGEECLKNIDQNPDIVVLDYYMNSEAPDAMNGLQVLKKIKSISNEIRVVMLSAQDKLDVAVDSIKAGAYEYVVKSETAFIRLQNTIKNIDYTVSFNREREKYTMWNYIVALLILLLVGINVLYYLKR